MSNDWQRTVAVYLVLIAAGVSGAISDAILNHWAKTNKLVWLLAAYASWITVATLLGFIFRWHYFSFGGAVILFLLVNSAGAILIDYQVFGERLTALQWLGVSLAVVAICCIEIGRTEKHESKETGHIASGR